MKRKEIHIYVRSALEAIGMILLALLVSLILGALTGCTRKVYVPVESTVTRTDTVYSAKFRVDSVIFRDSVAVVQRGDTVLVTKYRDRYRLSQRTDTVYQAAVDSVEVRVPYPVERELTKWQQAKMDLGGMAMGATAFAAVGLIAAVVWIVKLKRRR